MSKKLKSKVAAFLLVLQFIFSFVLPLQPLVSLVQAQETQAVTFSKEEASIVVANSQAKNFRYFFQTADAAIQAGEGQTVGNSFELNLKSQSGEDEVIFEAKRLVLKTDLNSYFLEIAENEVRVLQEYQSDSLELNADESNFLANSWQVNSDARMASTSSKVVLNQEYRFPLNEEVQVTFSKLPEQSSPLSIQEVQLSTTQQAMLGAVSAVAYDVTTTMQDGEFAFDLVLPKTENKQNVEVKFAETISELTTAETAENELVIGGEEVTVKNLKHMTIFVVVSPVQSGGICASVPGSTPSDECYNTIQEAINAANSGDTIHVMAGTYAENISINKSINLRGFNADINPNTGSRAAEAIIDGQGGTAVSVLANDVTINGFTIKNLSGKNAISASNYSNLTIISNIVRDIGNNDLSASGTNYGIAVTSSSVNVDNIIISDNKITEIHGGNKRSADGIAIGWSDGLGLITNAIIERNFIINVSSDTSDFGLGGRGAYGIIVNHGTAGGQTVGIQIKNNSIANLEGLWSHGIGLEGDTPNAVVTGNTITNLTDQKSPSDAIGVQFEANPSAGTVTLSGNTFSDVLVSVQNTVLGTSVDARNNTWSVANQSDLNQIEAVVNQNCSSSPFVHGLCGVGDQTGYGFVKYANIEPPTNLGWNVSSKSTTPNETPLDLACSATSSYTNENSVAQNWSDVAGTGIKYQRQVTYPSGAIGYFNAGSLIYTPFSTFGSASGIEGLWKTKVRSYVDVNNNNVPDSGEETSNWSNECNITLDKTAPAKPTLVSPANNAWVSGNPTQAWSNISDAHHYIYQSSSVSDFSSIIYETSVSGTSRTVGGNQTIGFWWRVRAVDAAGNESPWSTAWFLNVDNVGPNAPMIQHPAAEAYFSSTPILNQWTAPIDGSGINHYRIEYKYDDGHTFSGFPYRETTANSRNHVPGLSEQGGVQFRVQAFDNLGNEGAWSEWRHYFYDATSPTATVSYSATAPINGNVIATLNPSEVITVTNNSGLLTYTFTNNGSFTFEFVDNAGNVGSATATVANIDRVAPVVAITAPTTSIVDEIVPINGTVTDANPHHYYLVVQNSSNVTIAGPGTVNRNTSFTDENLFNWNTAALADGLYTIRLEARDSANNKDAGSVATKTVRIDRSAPVTSDDIADSNWHASDVTVNLSCADSGSLCDKTHYSINGASFVEGSSFTLSAEGEYVISYYSTDLAGNTESTKTALHTVKIDKTDPTSLITAPSNEGSNSVVYTNTWDGVISGTASDSASGLASVELSIQRTSDNKFFDGSAWTGDTEATRVPATGTANWSYDLGEVSEDSYSIISHAIDNAGNVENSYELTIVFDKTIPEVNLSINPTLPDGKNGWYQTQTTITLSMTDDKKTDYIAYQWQNQSGTWTTYAGPIQPSSEGNHALYYKAIDQAGNSSAVGVKNVAWDKTELTDAPLKVDATPDRSGGPNAKVTWEAATDNVGIDHYKVTFDLLNGNADFSEDMASHIRELSTDRLQAEGTWKVTVTAYDGAGHEKSASDDIVVDRSAASSIIPGAAAQGGGQVGPDLNQEAEVLGVDTEEQPATETPATSNGEVQGANTSCNDLVNSLWWILLLLQFAALFMVEYKSGNKQKWLKLGLYALLTVLPFVLTSYLVNATCFANGFTSWMLRYYFVPVLATAMLARVASYLLIEDES